jgi:hypothetical protein
MDSNASVHEFNDGVSSSAAYQSLADEQKNYTYLDTNSQDVYQPLVDQQENYRPKYHCDRVWGRVDWTRAIE